MCDVGLTNNSVSRRFHVQFKDSVERVFVLSSVPQCVCSPGSYLVFVFLSVSHTFTKTIYNEQKF